MAVDKLSDKLSEFIEYKCLEKHILLVMNLIDEDVASRALELARSKNVDFAEVRYQIDEDESIYMRVGIVEAYGISITGGLSIRVMKGGAFGFSSTDRIDMESIRKAVEQAIKLAESQKGGKIELSEEKTHVTKYEQASRIDPFEVPLGEKVSLLADIDKTMQALGNGVKVPFRNISIMAKKTHKLYTNSEGTSIRSNVHRFMISCYYVLAYKNRTITRHIPLGEAIGWEAVKKWDPIKKFEDDAKALIRIIQEAQPVKTDVYDVILGPEVSGLATHESCGHPFELDRIMGREGAQAGESYATVDMLGTRIAKDVVTIIDDPTLPNSYGFYLFDDEGVKARPRYLIRGGIVNEFLMNREYAAKIGKNSNAAARASEYNREPIIRMANTYIAPGDHRFEELLEGIKRGIYIKTFGEWNIDDRRFNQRYVGQEAYLIENGQITVPLWRPIFEITTPKYYESIDAVDKNLEFQPATCGKGDPGQGVPVFTGGPNIRLRNVRILSGGE